MLEHDVIAVTAGHDPLLAGPEPPAVAVEAPVVALGAVEVIAVDVAHAAILLLLLLLLAVIGQGVVGQGGQELTLPFAFSEVGFL